MHRPEVCRLAGMGPSRVRTPDEEATIALRLLTVVAALDPHAGAVLARSHGGEHRVLAATGWGQGPEAGTLLRPVTAGLLERVWDAGAPIRSVVADEPLTPLRRHLDRLGCPYLFCAPLGAPGGPVGALLLCRRDRAFTAEEEQQAAAAADLTGGALAGLGARHAAEPRDACLEAVLERTGDAVWICRSDGVVLRCNPVARAFHLRMGRFEEPVGAPLLALLGLHAQKDGVTLLYGEGSGEVRCVGPAGAFLLAYGVWPLAVGGGAVHGAVLVGRDVTDQERRRQAGAHQERLAALGQLAAGAAHEIRNPLTAVLGFLQLVASQVRTEPQAHYLRIVRQEIDRIERITADLLLLSRSWRQRGADCDMGRLIETVAELVRPRATERAVSLRLCVAADLPAVTADPERLEQVFLNLVGNAIEAVRGSGHVDLLVRLHPGGFVEGVVADDGPGVPPEVLPHLFEPFFTTKAGGTGLGLAVSDSIVRGFGGHITVGSQPGGGAVFTVRLPIAEAASAVEVASGLTPGSTTTSPVEG